MRQNHAKQRPSGFHPHGQFPHAAVATAMQPIQSISRKASDQHMASTATTFPRNCSRCASFIAGATKPSNPVIPISKDSHPPKTRHSILPAYSIPRLSECVGRSLTSSQSQRKGQLLQSLTTEQCNGMKNKQDKAYSADSSTCNSDSKNAKSNKRQSLPWWSSFRSTMERTKQGDNLGDLLKMLAKNGQSGLKDSNLVRRPLV